MCGHQESWGHHVSGWQWILDSMTCLHHPNGVNFVSYMDELVDRKILHNKFIGFLHHAPIHPSHERYDHRKGLKFTLESDCWRQNESKCLGVFTLCDYTKDYISSQTTIPVCSLKYPLRLLNREFNFESFMSNRNKKLIFIGAFLRDFHIFEKVDSPFDKIILQLKLVNGCTAVTRERVMFDDVKILPFLSSAVYQDYLSKNIVYLKYHDVAASNTIVECMAMNTPVIVNRLPAIEEYLGKDYPLFYNTLEESNELLHSFDRLKEGHLYLKKLDKQPFSIECFLHKFSSSSIYQSINV